jgi:type IV pilus assembly protein PilM
MSPLDAEDLRLKNVDRRCDRKDPYMARRIHQATRPVVDKLMGELAMCVRYHSVTFRGQPLERLVLGGGEASAQLLEVFQKRLGCELSDPLRLFQTAVNRGRLGQWDVAAGLALRKIC